jgi:hypothetical protein|tara:strand:- start:313 stop:600 length:288 start_codon:yes stop_codon:yes gene_type:complete
MEFCMNKAAQIRQSLIDLNPYASNREIVAHCQSTYGFKPSSQAIYEAIGSEKERKAETFNGRELMQVKAFARKSFDGDYNRLYNAVKLVMSSFKE